MMAAFRKLTWLSAATLLLSGLAMAQTGAIEGDVKGEDGSPVPKGDCKKSVGACVKIERTDIKGNYQTSSDKKGHYFHAGLPLGTYNVTLEIDGKARDSVKGVRTKLGDPIPVNFDLQAMKQKQAAMNQAVSQAAETGGITKEMAREMSPEQKAAIDKAMKERQQAMAKNKELNDAFNTGMEALKGRQFDAAATAFEKASVIDPKQHVIWAQLAESYVGQAAAKTGQEQTDIMAKGLDAYAKALEMKPDDAAYHNNFALALAKAKKFKESQEELTKAANLDPSNAGRYFYNLGAILINTGQNEPAGDAFKMAIEKDPNYADAYFQYGMYLVGKSTTTADGKVTAPPGTVEAFKKYVELKPDSPNSQVAKDMITSITGSVSTEYKNPTAPAPKKSTKKK